MVSTSYNYVRYYSPGHQSAQRQPDVGGDRKLTSRSLLAACAVICLLVAAGRVHAQTAPGAPTIDSVTATATSLTVVWSAPSDDGGSAINSYDLRYIESDATDASKADDANWTLEEDAWTTGALSYEIAGLRDSTGYDVQVRAENSALAGDWSSTSTGTTNDHGATISSATAITLDSSVHGRVHVTGDEDYFELVLGSATDLLVYTTGDFDTAGAVRNSVGATTVSNDDGGLPPDPAHLAIREELAAGTWYISVGGNGAQQTGSYTLHVRAAAAASTTATATEVGLDALVPGTLSAGGVHFFRIEPTSATDLWVLAIGDTDTKGKLLDSSQSVIAQNDDSELTDNESSFSLRASVEADETYYIKVQGGDSDAAGSYILYVRSVAGPGDSSATASPLMLTVPAPGRIDATEDEDYFSLTLESTTYVLLEAHDHGGTLGLTPTLFDSQDMEIDLYYLNEGGWPAIDGKDLSLWALERLPAGTYTIRIEGATSDTGAYVLHASVAADAVAEEESCLALGTSQDDPLYGCEWHLENTGQFGSGAGYDINVEAAWETTLGEGVNVVIVDEGLDYLHSDLRGYEYESADPDDDTMGHHDITGLGVRYPGAVHGTQVAGIIAGRDNDIGVRGVAPRATIYGYNLWGGISQRPGLANEANAAAHLADVTAVSNNSWRLPSFGTMRTANSDWEMAVEEGVRSGYDGKGVFYVWIAGNGHPQNNANLDERQNHYAVTTVCAVDYNDVRAGYSELGANLWICAPSQDKDADLPGIATTSVGNTYDLNFTGTSAAAPIVSGVAALVRAANRDLFWRDVKLILATSARKNDPANTGWQDGALKYGSADEHYSFSHEYGFGVVDAGAAVALANNWTPLPAFREVSATASPALAIPDPPSSGTADAVSSSVTLGPHVGFVEFLAIELGLTHRNYRDLRIELVSPTGATSTLLPPDVEASRSSDKRADDVTYRLGSARHLGEQAAGEWTLRITDERTGDTGRLHSWKLTAYGHGYIPDSPSITSANAGPGAITLAWTAPDDTGASAVSAYDVRYIRSAEADKADDNWTEVEDAWSSGDLEYEVGGLVGAVGYDLQVRAVNDQGAGGWSETIEATTPTVPGAAAITGVSPRDGELVVTWSAPADDGGIAIERYDLRYIESNATDKADANWTEPASIWTSTVGGDLRDLISLVNGTAYDLQVRAANGAGSGEWSATVAGTPAIQNHDPEFPATEDGARSVDENTPAGQNIGAPVQAPDPERDALSYTLSGADAASFDIVATSGQLRTKKALDHEDTAGYSVTVQVSDGTNTNGETDPAIDDVIGVIITIDDVPERPEFSGPAHVTREENSTAYVGRYSATDPEGTIVTWVALAGPDAGHFGLSEAGDLSFTTVPDYEARPSPHNVYRVTVRASDADGAVGTLPVAVTVTDMNEAPAISGPDTIDIDEGHAGMLGDYASEDPEGGTVNWGSVGDAVALGGADAGAFEFDQLTGRLTFASPPDFEQGKAQYQVTLHANDGELTGELAITVNVENVEEPGSLTLGARLGVLNVALIATLQDPDGIVSEMWQWQRSMSLTGVWADIANTDSGSYTPVATDRDHYLNATVTYTDGYGPGKTARAATEFTTANQRGPSNNPPQLPDAVDDIAIPEDSGGGRMVGTVTASDLDNDPLTYELSGASEFAIGRESGQIVVADGAAFDFETDPVRYTLTVTADDGFGGSDTVDVTIQIENVNEPPTAVADARETPEDEPITIEVLTNVSDPDRDDTLTLVRLGERPLHGTATVQSGANEIHYRPHEDYHGADNFSYVVRDGAGLTATGSVSITIEPLNDAPVFPAVTAERSVSEVAEEGTEVGAPVAASDVDGNSLSYSLAGGAAHFEIDEFTGQIRVAPGAMLDATTDPTHTVTVTADDQSGEPNARATIEVTITVSEGPVTPPIIFTGGGGGAPSGPSPQRCRVRVERHTRHRGARQRPRRPDRRLVRRRHALAPRERLRRRRRHLRLRPRERRTRRGPRVRPGRRQPRASWRLVRPHHHLGLRQRQGKALRPRPRERRAPPRLRPRAAPRQRRPAGHLVRRLDHVGPRRPRRRPLRLRPRERRTARRVRPARRQRHASRHLVRRRRRLGLRPQRQASLRLPPAPDRGRGCRGRGRGPRARTCHGRGVQETLRRQQQQPPRSLVRRRRHVRRRCERRQGLHLQHARRHRRAPRLAHPQRGRLRGLRPEPYRLRGRRRRGCDGDHRGGGGGAAWRDSGHRPARCRRGGGGPPGCPAGPWRDHRDRDLGGREPRARLPRAGRRSGAGGPERSPAPVLPGRRCARVQPGGLRGRQRRGAGGLRSEPPRHGPLHPARRKLRAVHPRSTRVREQLLRRAVRRRRPRHHAPHHQERGAAHSRSRRQHHGRRPDTALAGVPARHGRHGLQPRPLPGRCDRGTRGLRGEPRHNGHLRPRRRRLLPLHPRCPGVREPGLPGAVHGWRPRHRAPDREERRRGRGGRDRGSAVGGDGRGPSPSKSVGSRRSRGT